MFIRNTLMRLGILSATIVFAPSSLVFAAPANFKAFMDQLIGLVDLGTLALFSLAIAYFFWSVVKSLWGYEGGNAEHNKKLRETLLWGVFIIFVMVSIWGIIRILQLTLSRGFL